MDRVAGNSLIVKIIRKLGVFYKHSFINSFITRLADYLDVSIKESKFVKFLSGKNKTQKQWSESLSHKVIGSIAKPVDYISDKTDYIKNTAADGSIIVELAESTVNKITVLDSRFIGTFMISFMLTALAWTARWGFGNLLFKIFSLAVLAASLFLIIINKSLMDIYRNSFTKKIIDRIFMLDVKHYREVQ